MKINHSQKKKTSFFCDLGYFLEECLFETTPEAVKACGFSQSAVKTKDPHTIL